MDPKEFDQNIAREELYKKYAEAQMELEVIAGTGIILPGSIPLVRSISACILAELAARKLLRGPAALMIEKIRVMKKDPKLLKQLVQQFGDQLANLDPAVLAEIPPEAFE
jgi:hypothetical protein